MHSHWTKNESFLARISLLNVNKKAANLFTFTEQIINKKIHISCSVVSKKSPQIPIMLSSYSKQINVILEENFHIFILKKRNWLETKSSHK